MRRAFADRSPQIRNEYFPSDRREITEHQRKMPRRGEQFGQQHDRPRELERLGALALRRDAAEFDVVHWSAELCGPRADNYRVKIFCQRGHKACATSRRLEA